MALVNFIIYTILTVEIILIIYLRKEVISLFMGLFSYFIGLLSRKNKEPTSDYEDIKSYILKELNKGFTFEQVTNTLKKAGCSDDIIKSVKKDIKDRNIRINM